MITPEEFISMLRKTTLTNKEQQGVIQILPRLSMKEIVKLSQLLVTDAKRKGKLLRTVEAKQEKMLVALDVDFRRQLKKEQK